MSTINTLRDALNTFMNKPSTENYDAFLVAALAAAPASVTGEALSDEDIRAIADQCNWLDIDYSYDGQIEFARAIIAALKGQKP